MLCLKGTKLPNVIADVVIDVLEKTPVVVILMVLYYVVFGSSDIDGMWVSVIGFTLLFSGGVISSLRVGISAVDRGQEEAALALGYTGWQSFWKIVLPQAARFILPGYCGSVVALLKDTAIVGYIAVQDLTKISDIVRSRTYEAFFPLIATAVIYFLLAWLLTVLIKKLERMANTKRRSEAKILKGVKTG